MRIGLLGTGPWARQAHAPALAAHPDVEFTGVWGRRPEAAAGLAAEYGVRSYCSPEDLFADVAAVAVALPPDVQAPLATRAAEAGRHLLLDKPVATTVEDARRVAAAAELTGIASVVFFTARFDPGTADWAAEQAAAGGWFTADARWLASLFAEAGPAGPAAPAGSSGPAGSGGSGAAPSPFADSPWRRERGALWDVGPHALSLLLPVLGDVDETDPAAVRAARGPGDTVHLILRHSGGAGSTVTLSLTAPPAASGVALELRGERGAVPLPGGAAGPQQCYARAVDALLTAARTGVAHACDAPFGLRVTEILAAAERDLGTVRGTGAPGTGAPEATASGPGVPGVTAPGPGPGPGPGAAEAVTGSGTTGASGPGA
ncbi:Gfo/Idh/MocA family protein [Streptomyces zingiberis]|uniref:Gfo/Idh/MocA family oxidoreductase n=1 Tax=Streptomyces zingiberis TaxID=2053010 RepID=A0ABX1BYG1_9ACTN|nr:Gfo/Idh/MocA family oxidoreductase [Streptomyces zingiberis]NJP99703.1 Gfo/Idh/MocA family oxidoreductase [Streptomyces zingiberis]